MKLTRCDHLQLLLTGYFCWHIKGANEVNNPSAAKYESKPEAMTELAGLAVSQRTAAEQLNS